MDRLWSPWRSKYIQTFDESRSLSEKSETESKTFISFAIDSSEDELNLVLLRTKYSIIIMNKYPYNNGHLLVCPKRAINDLLDLTDNEFYDLNNTLKQAIKILIKIYKPHGYNVGLNIGSAAGAGVPKHLHYHIVPRWEGDTNFMTTVADMKVMSQSMEESYTVLKKEFEQIQVSNTELDKGLNKDENKDKDSLSDYKNT